MTIITHLTLATGPTFPNSLSPAAIIREAPIIRTATLIPKKFTNTDGGTTRGLEEAAAAEEMAKKTTEQTADQCLTEQYLDFYWSMRILTGVTQTRRAW